MLQRVIDDLRDLADADAGTLRLHPEPVRCDELLDQVAAAHRVGADAAGVALRTAVDGTPWLDADPVRMRQALGNLVSNALRHTPADGIVTLAARRDGDFVVLEVADTGSGMAPDELPHVFDRFWRAEKSRSRRTGAAVSACRSSGTWSPRTAERPTPRANPAPAASSRYGCPERPGGTSHRENRSLPWRPRGGGRPDSDRVERGTPSLARRQRGRPGQ